MRVAVLSDIHSNRSALEAVLAVCDRLGITDIFNLGDSLSGPFDPAGTADILIDRAIPSIRCNHDRMLLDPADRLGLWERWAVPELREPHFDWVRHLPETIDWQGLHFTHAAPGDDAENWLDYRGPQNRLVARRGKRWKCVPMGSPRRSFSPAIPILPAWCVFRAGGSSSTPARLAVRPISMTAPIRPSSMKRDRPMRGSPSSRRSVATSR